MKKLKRALHHPKAINPVPLWAFSLAFGTLLAGCAVGPDYRPPRVAVEKQFAEAGKMDTTNSPTADWWRTFHDPELDQLIQRAARGNYSLQMATSRIRQARYQRNIAAAGLFPNIDADAGYLRGYGSKNVQLPVGGDPPGDPPAANPNDSSFDNQLSPLGKGGLTGKWTDLYQIGFDATWEIDVFGGTRRRIEAAEDQMQAAVDSQRDVTVTLFAEVAQDYFELRGTQKRLDIAQKNLHAEQAILDLTRSQCTNGLASDLDVAQAATEVAVLASRISPLKAGEHRLVHGLSVLLARQPGRLAGELDNAGSLPIVPPKIPVGLPSQLIERRPDIRAAERQLAAATANIGAAKADLFPKFALTSGSMGLDSSTPETLFNWGSRYFLISPTLTWRVFDAGRIFSNVKYHQARRQEAVLQFRHTVLVALREVEDALSAYALEHERRAQLAEALHGSAITLALARQQYQQGLTTFLNVLDAERNLYSAEDQLAQSDQAICTDLVALYKALGGGWQTGFPIVAEKK